jgi:hypothetical protein
VLDCDGVEKKKDIAETCILLVFCRYKYPHPMRLPCDRCRQQTWHCGTGSNVRCFPMRLFVASMVSFGGQKGLSPSRLQSRLLHELNFSCLVYP